MWGDKGCRYITRLPELRPQTDWGRVHEWKRRKAAVMSRIFRGLVGLGLTSEESLFKSSMSRYTVFLLTHCRVSNYHCIFYYFSSACVQACYNILVLHTHKKKKTRFQNQWNHIYSLFGFTYVFWILSIYFACYLVAGHLVIKIVELFYTRNSIIVIHFPFFHLESHGGYKLLHCINHVWCQPAKHHWKILKPNIFFFYFVMTWTEIEVMFTDCVKFLYTRGLEF